MINEEIVEIRRIRHEISAQFNHDPRKVVAYYRDQKKKFLQSGEFRLTKNVSLQTILKHVGWTELAKSNIQKMITPKMLDFLRQSNLRARGVSKNRMKNEKSS